MNNANCRTHPTYRAKRQPRSNCARCAEIYMRERRKYDIAREAADQLVKLLGVDHLTLDVRYEQRYPFDSGVRVEICHTGPEGSHE